LLPQDIVHILDRRRLRRQDAMEIIRLLEMQRWMDVLHERAEREKEVAVQQAEKEAAVLHERTEREKEVAVQ
jgi:hypothetical protein